MKYLAYFFIAALLSVAACKADKRLKDDTKPVTKLDPKKDTASQIVKPVNDTSANNPSLKKIPTPSNTTITNKKMWYIIGGSFKQFKNAEKLYAKLSESGYDDSEIMDPSKEFNRVVISSFTDEAKARAELARLRAARSDNSIWLLEGK